MQRLGIGGGRGYSARANDELVQWLRAHSRPDDRVFIFGMQGGVYFEAQRLPAHRFLWVGPAVEGLLEREDFNLERLAADLAASRPQFIIREANNGDGLLGWKVQTESSQAAPCRRCWPHTRRQRQSRTSPFSACNQRESRMHPLSDGPCNDLRDERPDEQEPMLVDGPCHNELRRIERVPVEPSPFGKYTKGKLHSVRFPVPSRPVL